MHSKWKIGVGSIELMCVVEFVCILKIQIISFYFSGDF